MKKKLISIILSLLMSFTMLISSATVSFADTLATTIPTASLLEFLTQQKTASGDIIPGLDLGTEMSMADLQKLLNQYGLTDATGLFGGMDVTSLQDVLKLFEIKDVSSLLSTLDIKDLSSLFSKLDMKDLSSLLTNLDIKDLSTILSKLDTKDLGTLVNKLDITDLSNLINKLDFSELKTLLSKFDLSELGKIFDNSNLSDVKALTKTTIDKAAAGSNNAVVKELVTKAYAAIDAAKSKNDVIAAGDKYVELITAALEAAKAEEERIAAEQREAELREAAEKLAAEKKLAEETVLVQNKLKVTSKGSIKVSFKAAALDGVINYEIQRATDKSFTKSLKTYTTKNLTLTNSKNLKKGTRYYFRVRANVQLSDSTMVTTAWSNVRYTKATKTR